MVALRIAFYHWGRKDELGERKESQNVMDKLMLRAAVATDRDLLSHTAALGPVMVVGEEGKSYFLGVPSSRMA